VFSSAALAAGSGELIELAAGWVSVVPSCEQSVDQVQPLDRGHQLIECIVEQHDCPVRTLNNHHSYGVGAVRAF
jgi:hypothetical protein